MSLLPNLDEMTDNEKMAVLESIQQSIAQSKEIQKQKIAANVDLVVQALKKIESDIRSHFDDVGNAIEKRVSTIKDGRDGSNGKDGRDGKDGRNGKDGAKGDRGERGQDGRDGINGVDGVSVTNANIDFDGSLIITLSTGVQINVGEVVAPDLAERIKVITNGGGTAQSVLDTLASLQTQITNLIPSQTGNSGKYLTTNGTALSWATIAGSLSYLGTWNASTNTPTLTSSVGTNGIYYIVATAGSTNLNGITDWQIGDWLLFNGTVWQKIDQSDLVQSITSADGSIVVTTTGSTVDLAVSQTSPASVLVEQVRNSTGATLTKGTAVYISGATGQLPTVTKAQANNDTNSAQTLGLITADISNNSNGYVTIIGLISNLNTSAYTDGAQLYLSPTTAGTLTATKPYAPNHLVYVAVVAHAHPTQGKLLVKVQNGYEMDELHNVSAQSPTSGQTLIYNASTSLWEKANLTAGTGISVSNGAGSITVANTGVTSVTGTSPVTSSGGATPAISLASGYGDTQNPFASKTANFVLAAPNGSAGVPTFRAVVAADIPTLNQNTTGTASNVTGTVALANGGSGQITAQLAMNAFAGAVTSGSYLRGNGTNVVMNTIQAADVPTLNQNTTGSAATVTTTINSGVVATTQTAGDNSTKVATTAYVNAITGTGGITGFKNRIINGNCQIAQYGALSITGNSTPKIYGGCDRITGLTFSFTTATGTLQQSGSGFGSAGLSQAIVGLTTTGSGGITFGQRIEAANITDCNGSSVTVQAKVFQNTGSSQSLNLRLNKANAVDNFSAVTILSTSSTFTIPTGVLTTVSATFSLGATDASNGILVEAFFSGLGAITSKDFHITDFQLEKGSTATSFDYRPYGTELALCQRYCQVITGVNYPLCTGLSYATTNSNGVIALPVTMRTSPTPTYAGATDFVITNGSGGGIACTAIGNFVYSPNTLELSATVASGLTAGQASIMRTSTGGTAKITLSAEL